jgi:thymidylate synthase
LGELLWYLAKSKDLKFITYYLSRYRKESEDGRTVYGGYGPRFFAMRDRHNQVATVLNLLKKKRDSRRAVIQLFDAADLAKNHKEIPCTCTLQFMIRRGRLHMFTSMRSNDAFLGLPHDVFAFTMLQEIFARTLGVDLGTYNHAVGSLHLYSRDRQHARDYLKEGWQPTAPMPSMPKTNPWSCINKLIKAERAIRSGRAVNIENLRLPPYWANLVRVLQIYAHSRRKEIRKIEQLKSEMSGHVYDAYIEDLITRLKRAKNKHSARN